jgi:molybdate transport system substrate-binding protein
LVNKVNVSLRKPSFKRVLSISLVNLVLILTLSSSCSPGASTITIFAAAASKPAIDDICQEFVQRFGVEITVNYGGGGEVLSRMILAQTGDIYIAPEQRFMDTATEKQAVQPDTIQSIAYMIPVIAVPKGNPAQITCLADLARPGVRLAITRPESTLLGKYAPEIFEKAGLGEAIQSNIITYASDPNNLLAMLVTGQVDAGILWHFYRTLAPDDIETISLSSEQLTGIGEMQIAVSAYSKDAKTAQSFIDFAISDDGKALFEKNGYITDSEELKQYWQ